MIVVCFSVILAMATTAVMPAPKGSEPSKVISKREVSTACEKGWYPFGDKCYRAGGTKRVILSWDKASVHCREHGGTLASIHSKEQSDFLTAFIMMDIQHHAWIGLNDRDTESHYKWEDGTEVNFLNWDPNEPSGRNHPEEDCVHILYTSRLSDGRSGNWNDLDCNQERELICQKNKRNHGKEYDDPRFCSPENGGGWKLGSSCYHVVLKELTWQEADAYCMEKHRGHLVTINNFRVNIFLGFILRNYTEDMWIGIKIKNEHQQKWSSGWYVVFDNWMKEPGDFLEGTCAVRTSDTWTTVPCNNSMPFICEFSTVPSLKTPDEAICPEEPAGWRDFGGQFCYYIETTHLTWFEANFRCLRRGGTLASFNSQDEMDILQPILMTHFIKARLFYWIGLHRHMQHEEEFVWVDGSPVDFTAWAINEPRSQGEQCAEMNPESLKWYDYFCDHQRPSICSVRKIASHRTAERIQINHQEAPAHSSGFSAEILIGVVLCAVIVTILLGTAIYYFCLQNKNHQQNRETFRNSLNLLLRGQSSRYRSADEIVRNECHDKNSDDDS